MTDTFAELRASAVDGRCHSVYYRQHQLEALHQALVSHASEIKEAIAADYDHSPAEIAIELHLAFSALKRNYDLLQPSQALANEYLLAEGKDAPANRAPAGIVYIEPCVHTLLFSVVAPLSAAIAAGNCVIVLLEHNLRALTGVLRQILQHALLPETFAVAFSPVRGAAILNSAIIVDQNSNELWPKANQLASPSRSIAFAIVDRTADVKLAAHELVAARFAVGGSSPYAPDLVLVNEFVKQDFLDAVVDQSRKLGSSTGPTTVSSVKSNIAGEKVQAFKRIDSALRIIVQEFKTAVVELTTRRPQMLETKIGAPLFIVYAVKSLDDAIDFIGSANGGPALAAYHFGNPQVGKYLAQFVDARVSFVNHIPRELLVGPAHPIGHISDPAVRYTADMFSLARPAFIRATATSSDLAVVLSSPSISGAQRLLDRALSPLIAMKRKPGGGVGFFEQGFLMNAGIILTVAISVTAAGTIWLVKNGRAPSWGLRV